MAKEKINFEDEQVRLQYRHTASHVLAQAVKNLWPDAKLAIGPAIDNGFYYDIDMEHKLSDQDLLKIQKERGYKNGWAFKMAKLKGISTVRTEAFV